MCGYEKDLMILNQAKVVEHANYHMKRSAEGRPEVSTHKEAIITAGQCRSLARGQLPRELIDDLAGVILNPVDEG
jgi:hypothetical protein